MDYTALFKDTGTSFCGNFRCTCYPSGGELIFSVGSGCPLLFVLSGRISVAVPLHRREVSSGYLLAVNKERLKYCICEAGTVVLEYNSSPLLTFYLKDALAVFGLPFSSSICIRTSLYTWIHSEMQKNWPSSPSQESLERQDREFAAIMETYTPFDLHELYACLFIYPKMLSVERSRTKTSCR